MKGFGIFFCVHIEVNGPMHTNGEEKASVCAMEGDAHNGLATN